MTKDVEIKTDNAQAQPTPAPVAPVTEVAEAVTPVDSHTEVAKHNAAFAAMRREAREAKNKLKAYESAIPPQAVKTEVPAVSEVAPVVATAPVPVRTEVDVEAESEKAVVELSKDRELAQVPGAIVDIITMVDTDPRLARLHAIDPTLAFREAKGIYFSKAGISPTPPIPKTTPTATGVKGVKEDLALLLNELDNCHPGTTRFNELKKKLDAIRRKG
jgi:hypothetical protein